MSYDASSRKSTVKYIREKQQQLTLRFKKDDFEARIRPAIRRSGLPAATFMKDALEMYMALEAEIQLISNGGPKNMDYLKRYIKEAVRDKIEKSMPIPERNEAAFLLLNKDRIVGRFRLQKSDFGEVLEPMEMEEQYLPIGFTDISSWLSGRKAVSHNQKLRTLLADLGCSNDLDYARLTYAGSLNDTYWMKEAADTASWSEVSYFRNAFNEVISLLAFSGKGLEGEEFSSTIPELSTDGAFPKCWKRDGGSIYLYKGGDADLKTGGSEPYCEVLASEIASKIGNAVKYSLDRIDRKTVSKCLLFTDEEHGYVPFSRFKVAGDIHQILQFMQSVSCEEAFREMLVIDAVTLNPDRHRGNYGFIVDNETGKILSFAPIFDFNMCLLPYCFSEDDLEKELKETWPKIGNDFISVGKAAMTEAIRKRLLELVDFRFTFRGNEEFPPERVEMLERLIQSNIRQILKAK